MLYKTFLAILVLGPTVLTGCAPATHVAHKGDPFLSSRLDGHEVAATTRLPAPADPFDEDRPQPQGQGVANTGPLGDPFGELPARPQKVGVAHVGDGDEDGSNPFAQTGIEQLAATTEEMRDEPAEEPDRSENPFELLHAEQQDEEPSGEWRARGTWTAAKPAAE